MLARVQFLWVNFNQITTDSYINYFSSWRYFRSFPSWWTDTKAKWMASWYMHQMKGSWVFAKPFVSYVHWACAKGKKGIKLHPKPNLTPKCHMKPIQWLSLIPLYQATKPLTGDSQCPLNAGSSPCHVWLCDIGLLCIAETWLTTREILADLARISPPPPIHGFSFSRYPALKERTGSCCLLVSQTSKCTPNESGYQSSFCLLQQCLDTLNIFRTHSLDTTFFGECEDIPSCMTSFPYNLVRMGDINLHVDSWSFGTRQLTDIL